MILSKDNITNATTIFLLVAVLQFLASFFMIPIYLNTFSVEEFGINEIINRVTLFISTIISLRVSGAMANIYFTLDPAEQKKSFVASLAGFTAISGIVGAVFVLIIGYFLMPLIFNNITFSMFPHGLCAILTAIASNMTSPYFFYLKNEQKLTSFLKINLFFIVFNIVLQLSAIYFFKVGFESIVNIRSVFALFQFMTMIIVYQQHFSLKIKWPFVRRALKYTIPLIPFLVLNWLQLYYDRFFVGKYLGAVALGIFSFILILQNIQATLTDVFENAIRPSLMNQFNKGTSQSLSLQKLQNQFLIALTLSASFILFATILIPFVTENDLYINNAVLFFLVVPSGVIKGLSLLFMQQLVFKEKSFELGVIVFFHLSCIFLCYYFFGKAASLVTILLINWIVSLFMLLIYYSRAQTALALPFSLSQFFLPLVFIFISPLLYYIHQFYATPIYYLLSFQLILILSFSVITYKKSRKISV